MFDPLNASNRVNLVCNPMNLITNPVALLANKFPIVYCTDAGFDMNGFWALAMASLSDRLLSVVTSLYRPDEKKSIVQAFIKVVAENLSERNPGLASRIFKVAERVFAGYGYYLKPEDLAPGLDVYDQTQPFIDNGIDLEPWKGGEELESFMTFLATVEEPITYVCTGPIKSLAEMLRRNPAYVREKIKVVVMNSPMVSPVSMGNNEEFNFLDIQTVLDSGVSCLIVPYRLCADYVLPKDLMEKVIVNREGLSKLEMLSQSIMVSSNTYIERRKNPKVDPSQLSLDGPVLADPLTMLLAMHPELIDTVRGLKYTFGVEPNDIDLPPSSTLRLVSVQEDSNSNVFEVIKLKSHEEVLQLLIEGISIEIDATKNEIPLYDLV